VTLAPSEQRALLKIEKTLRKDPAVGAALEAFNRRCPYGKDPVRERLSPWRPLLWRTTSVTLVTLMVAFMMLIMILVIRST
jgi:hypothetical protein